MTIAEKWRQMLAAFIDIKQAITDMGEDVSGGFETYANAIRAIYGGTAAAEIPRPEGGDDNVENISADLEWCKAVKEQIRLAIAGGGVDCGSDIALSEYGDKIREISTLKIITASVSGLYCDTEANYQLEASGGVPPYTWTAIRNMSNGLSLSKSGVITGKPGAAGTVNATVKCTDSRGKSVTAKVSIKINKVSLTVYIEETDDGGIYSPANVLYKTKVQYDYDGTAKIPKLICKEAPQIEFKIKNAEMLIGKGGYPVKAEFASTGYSSKYSIIDTNLNVWII